MEAFAKFIESDAFFPVLILLLVMLLGVFIWVLLSGKNEEKKRRAKQKANVDETKQIKIVQEDIVSVTEHSNVNSVDLAINQANQVSHAPLAPNMELSGYKTNPTPVSLEPQIIESASPEEIQNVMPEITEPKREEVSMPVRQEDITNNQIGNIAMPKIDIPINTMNDTEVEIPEVKEAKEIMEPKVEEPVQNTYVEKTEETPVEIPNQKESDAPDELAFNSLPTTDQTINENIVVEKPQEYLGEKTEIFDFPNFDEYENLAETKDIEQDIIDTANKYIESIMGNR